jgi:hypothetical protein
MGLPSPTELRLCHEAQVLFPAGLHTVGTRVFTIYYTVLRQSRGWLMRFAGGGLPSTKLRATKNSRSFFLDECVHLSDLRIEQTAVIKETLRIAVVTPLAFLAWCHHLVPYPEMQSYTHNVPPFSFTPQVISVLILRFSMNPHMSSIDPRLTDLIEVPKVAEQRPRRREPALSRGSPLTRDTVAPSISRLSLTLAPNPSLVGIFLTASPSPQMDVPGRFSRHCN